MACSKMSSTVVTAGLPDDPLMEILSCLPVKSLCRFKCVSKAWRALITDPIHRKKLPQTTEGIFFMESGFRCAGAGAGAGCKEERFGFVDLAARSVPLDIDPCFSFLTARLVPLDVDPCFSFLTTLPELRVLAIQDSCNGLLLFEHRWDLHSDAVLGFIVCNPTTKQWVAVPTCDCPLPAYGNRHIYLAFDPAISSHFHLVQFGEEFDLESFEHVRSVHAYSSESGIWSHSGTDWDEHDMQGVKRWHEHPFPYEGPRHAFVNGMLHLLVWDNGLKQNQILVVDVKGKTQTVIPVPTVGVVGEGVSRLERPKCSIAQSQGHLHYFSEVSDLYSEQGYQVWVLQDYDLQEWVFKHHVSCLRPGQTRLRFIERMVAIHQNGNVVFFLQNGKLKAYDMESKEVRALVTSDNRILSQSIAAPYVPCFSESPVLTNEH